MQRVPPLKTMKHAIVWIAVLALLLTGCTIVKAPPELPANIGVPETLSISATKTFGSVESPVIRSNCPEITVSGTKTSGDTSTADITVTSYKPTLSNCLKLEHTDGAEPIKTIILPEQQLRFTAITAPDTAIYSQEYVVEFPIEIVQSTQEQDYVIKAETTSTGVLVGGENPTTFELNADSARYNTNAKPTTTLQISNTGDKTRTVELTFKLYVIINEQEYLVDEQTKTILAEEDRG